QRYGISVILAVGTVSVHLGSSVETCRTSVKLTSARSAPLGMTVMTNPGFGVAEISSTWPAAARTVASPQTMRKLRRYRPSPSESQPSTVDGDADADGHL